MVLLFGGPFLQRKAPSFPLGDMVRVHCWSDTFHCTIVLDTQPKRSLRHPGYIISSSTDFNDRTTLVLTVLTVCHLSHWDGSLAPQRSCFFILTSNANRLLHMLVLNRTSNIDPTYTLQFCRRNLYSCVLPSTKYFLLIIEFYSIKNGRLSTWFIYLAARMN